MMTFYSLGNLHKLPQYNKLSEEAKTALKVVGSVLPFRVNNYVTENLIDWDNFEKDPIYRLTFVEREMLSENQFQKMKSIIEDSHSTQRDINETANSIRRELNPHPSGQLTTNIPSFEGKPVPGVQHKYRETVLIFPSQAQQCHSYCTFCFRWAQFVGDPELKFSTNREMQFLDYISSHKEVSDVLITGGDPMIMQAKGLSQYILPFLEKGMEHIKNIRIGSKSLTYWPYRFTHDKDSEEVLSLFRLVKKRGKHLSFMAHINHPQEMKTKEFEEAVCKILETGATIRTQSPLIRRINDSSEIWSDMWKKQVKLGMIPYYMFVERDTGPKHFFELPLSQALKIYQEAIRNVSGLARTARGPSMSAYPGKVCVDGVVNVHGKKVFVLSLLQARSPELVKRPFFAEYDGDAKWLTDLRPAFADRFPFE